MKRYSSLSEGERERGENENHAGTDSSLERQRSVVSACSLIRNDRGGTDDSKMIRKGKNPT